MADVDDYLEADLLSNSRGLAVWDPDDISNFKDLHRLQRDEGQPKHSHYTDGRQRSKAVNRTDEAHRLDIPEHSQPRSSTSRSSRGTEISRTTSWKDASDSSDTDVEDSKRSVRSTSTRKADKLRSIRWHDESNSDSDLQSFVQDHEGTGIDEDNSDDDFILSDNLDQDNLRNDEDGPLDPDGERILHPIRYFERLRGLESRVLNRTCVHSTRV